ncbi:type VI secretion system membrane subunit TssM [Nitratireductor sp. GCM10026969]|uniref:type VI secretion system membrane subunit TssM n=1 Tax=Nitratireductor sp. GCM10026969 TaxID=3252645 RepID=UPI0036135C7B
MSGRTLLRRIGRSMLRRGVLLTILAVLLALAVWFLGPLVGYGEVRPFASVAVRLVLLLLIALAWGIGGLFMRAKRSSEEQALLAALRKQKEEEDAAADREAAKREAAFQDFRSASREALRYMRKGRGGLFANASYALPWYLVLGEQNSGKSALARGAASTLPFREDTDEAAAAGSFHISDEAVLVEFSGDLFSQSERRFTILWSRMLDHLRHLRPQQPLNGILVVASVEQLLGMSQESAIDFATIVRRRVDEVSARLRTRAPVYLVVTKLDLLLGFEEFFETLGAEERSAVLGFPLTPPLRAEAGAQADMFGDGFAKVTERLSERLMMRLQEEPDELRRRRIFEFPSQFALLKSRLQPLVEHAVATHRFGEAPMVRGLFFASATQSGAFADVTAEALASDFGHRPAGLTPRPDSALAKTRTFFMRGLVGDVIAPESHLSGLTRPARFMNQARGVAANVLLTVAAVTLLAFWWLAFSEGRAYTARLDEYTAAARAGIAEAAPDGEMPSSFGPVLEVLDHLRRLSQEAPRRSALGLYPTGNVHEAAQAAYERALANMAFPFVWRYLADGLGDPRTPGALRFQQLKFYLMLAGERPVAPATAIRLAPDFAAKWLLYERGAEIDQRVSGHFASLASVDLDTPAPDLALVDRARSLISDYTLARLAYDTALSYEEVRQLPVWRPVDHMGLAGPQALSRVSGASFWDGIPGIYTKEGFSDVMLEASGKAAEATAEDLWVMGGSDTSSERETRRIQDGVLDLYRADYITRWDRLLSDLDMIDTASAGEMARALALVVGQPSPVKELTAAAAKETNLSADDGSPLSAFSGAAGRALDTTSFAPRRVVDVAGAVTEHFRAFRQAVIGADDQQAQVDAMIAALEPLYRQINHVATGGDVLELGVEPQTLFGQLNEQVDALPESLQPLFRRIVSHSAAMTGGLSRQRLSNIWSTTVLPLCRSTTEARYPFDPESGRDASLEDFASLFGPSGAIAAFRNDYLKPYIDSTTKPWRWRTGQQFGLGLDEEVLSRFELAADITSAYFGDSDQPAVRFTIEPIRLDARARAFQLDIGGPTLVYAHGPPEATPLEWPPERSTADAILSLSPEIDGKSSVLRRQGSWALFRLFDAGRMLDAEATDTIPYQFTIGGREVLLEVTAPPTGSPLSHEILSNFQCPEL